MAGDKLRPIAIATRDISRDDAVDLDSRYAVFRSMTLVGIVGLFSQLDANAHNAVASCAQAGVSVRLLSHDHVEYAKAIAVDCGIISQVHDVGLSLACRQRQMGYYGYYYDALVSALVCIL